MRSARSYIERLVDDVTTVSAVHLVPTSISLRFPLLFSLLSFELPEAHQRPLFEYPDTKRRVFIYLYNINISSTLPIDRLENTIIVSKVLTFAACHLLATYEMKMKTPALSLITFTCIRPTIKPGNRTENTLEIGATRSCHSPNHFERIPQDPVKRATVLVKVSASFWICMRILPEQDAQRHDIITVELLNMVSIHLPTAIRILTDEKEDLIHRLRSTSKSQPFYRQGQDRFIELCLFDDYPRGGIM
jgi:hypothetical protein